MQTRNIITSAICLAILIGGINTAAVNAVEQTAATTAITTGTSSSTPSIEDLEKIVAELKVQIQATLEKIQEIAKTRNTTSAAIGSTSACIAENEIATDTNRNCCGSLLKVHVSVTSLPVGCGSASTPCTSTTENYTCKKTTILGYGTSSGTTTTGTGVGYSSGGSGTTTGYSTGVGYSYGGSGTTTGTGNLTCAAVNQVFTSSESKQCCNGSTMAIVSNPCEGGETAGCAAKITYKCVTGTTTTTTTACEPENATFTDSTKKCCSGLVITFTSQTRVPAGCGPTTDNGNGLTCTSITANYTCKKATTTTTGTGVGHSFVVPAGTTLGTGVGHSLVSGTTTGTGTGTMVGYGTASGTTTGSAGTTTGYSTASGTATGTASTTHSTGTTVGSTTGTGSNSNMTIQQQIQAIQQQINKISAEISSWGTSGSSSTGTTGGTTISGSTGATSTGSAGTASNQGNLDNDYTIGGTYYNTSTDSTYTGSVGSTGGSYGGWTPAF